FSGSYTIRERAAVGISNIDPVLTLWDFDGDFLGVGTTGTAAGVSEITFDAVAGKTYFVVAGTGFDRVLSNPAANTINGVTGTPSQGPYAIEIAPSWATLNTATRQIIVTGDGNANTITSVLSGTDVRVDFGGEHIQIPAAQVVGMQFNGGAGGDDYEFDLDG